MSRTDLPIRITALTEDERHRQVWGQNHDRVRRLRRPEAGDYQADDLEVERDPKREKIGAKASRVKRSLPPDTFNNNAVGVSVPGGVWS